MAESTENMSFILFYFMVLGLKIEKPVIDPLLKAKFVKKKDCNALIYYRNSNV